MQAKQDPQIDAICHKSLILPDVRALQELKSKIAYMDYKLSLIELEMKKESIQFNTIPSI